MAHSASTQTGFSLLELMVVLCISAFMAMISAPHLNQFIDSKHATAELDNLYHTLVLARSQAIVKLAPITVCALGKAKTCGNDWTNGYMVFVDKQLRGTPKNDSDIVHLHAATFIPLFYRGFPQDNKITFTPAGFTHFDNGTFMYCAKGHEKEVVSVNQLGQVKVKTLAQFHAEQTNELRVKPFRCPFT